MVFRFWIKPLLLSTWKETAWVTQSYFHCFNFELAWIPGLGTIYNFCHSFNEVRLQYSKSQGQWIGMWSLLFLNPNKYILAILAGRHCVFSKKWDYFITAAENLGASTTFPRVECVQPQSNKPVSALHKLLDLQSLTETELRKQTSKLQMWRNERIDWYWGNSISDSIFWILNLTLSCHPCAQQRVEGSLTAVVSQQTLSQHAWYTNSCWMFFLTCYTKTKCWVEGWSSSFDLHCYVYFVLTDIIGL